MTAGLMILADFAPPPTPGGGADMLSLIASPICLLWRHCCLNESVTRQTHLACRKGHLMTKNGKRELLQAIRTQHREVGKAQ